jgi:uncharacterized protein (DUF2147 family)
VWQNYDYYLEPTAGYFGAKKACEPLHIQWNPVTDNIEVVNYSAGDARGLTAAVQLLNMDGAVKWEKTATLDSSEDSVAAPIHIEYPDGLTPVHFIRLKLTRGGETVSDNFYWRGLEEYNYKALRDLPKVKLEARVLSEQRGGRWHLSVTLHNPAKTPALMVKVKVILYRADAGREPHHLGRSSRYGHARGTAGHRYRVTVMRKIAGASAALLLATLAVWATEAALLTPVGRWKTIDDKTGKPKAIVQVYLESGKLYGKIEATLDPNAKKFCDKCKDARKGRPVVGMVIMRGLALQGDEYSGGDILDPDNGSVYRCKLHLQEHGNQLAVRGFIGFSLLGRSQVWTREQ